MRSRGVSLKYYVVEQVTIVPLSLPFLHPNFIHNVYRVFKRSLV